MKCIVFLLESTMISTTDETENVTQTVGRTKTYGNHVVTAKMLSFFSGAITSLILIIVILRECYKFRQRYGLFTKYKKKSHSFDE